MKNLTSRIEMFSWLSFANLLKKKITTQVFSCKISSFHKNPVIFYEKTVVNLFYKNYVKQKHVI